MTRAQIESGQAVHPLEAVGVGRAPYQVATVIRLPDRRRAETDRAVAERRRKAIESNTTLFRVDPATCACCRRGLDTLYLLETAERVNAPICFDCLVWSGDRGLRRKAAHLDHEHDRLMARISRRDRRR